MARRTPVTAQQLQLITEAELGAEASPPTSEPQLPCSRRPHIRSGSPARSWAPAEPRFRSSSGEPLASWVLDPDLDKYRRTNPRVFVGAALDTIAGGIPDDIRADYLACHDCDRFAESMRYVRRYPEELPVLAGLLPQITVPVTIINGRHDRVVPLRGEAGQFCLRPGDQRLDSLV